MPNDRPELHMVCGKIASGKSTLTAELGRAARTVVISEDRWLHALFGDEMNTLADFVRCSARLRGIMAPHIVSLLQSGVSVVLDFQANTVEARNWMRGILGQTDAGHVLHVLDVPDKVCLQRLRVRNADGDHPFTVTEEQFMQVSKHFVPPSRDENFNVVVHR